jgi:hypothetical protein
MNNTDRSVVPSTEVGETVKALDKVDVDNEVQLFVAFCILQNVELCI